MSRDCMGTPATSLGAVRGNPRGKGAAMRQAAARGPGGQRPATLSSKAARQRPSLPEAGGQTLARSKQGQPSGRPRLPGQASKQKKTRLRLQSSCYHEQC